MYQMGSNKNRQSYDENSTDRLCHGAIVLHPSKQKARSFESCTPQQIDHTTSITVKKNIFERSGVDVSLDLPKDTPTRMRIQENCDPCCDLLFFAIVGVV